MELTTIPNLCHHHRGFVYEHARFGPDQNSVEVRVRPRACNPASGWEKGKVERGGIGYVRQNFWPLRDFTDLQDVNRQARQWLAEVAHQRLHHETRQRPIDRFRADALRPLPVIPYDYRDTVEALVHKDLRLQFDGNRYCVPHRFVGRQAHGESRLQFRHHLPSLPRNRLLRAQLAARPDFRR
jgi:predicted ester cyclase